MNETPKNLEQKIDTIESMISFAKQKFVTQDATSMILIGWFVSIFFCLQGLSYYSKSIQNGPLIIAVAIIMIIFSIVFLFITIKNDERVKRERQQKNISKNSYVSYLQNTIVLGIALGFSSMAIGISILENNFLETPYFGMLLLAFLGTVIFINSRLAYYKWVAWFGIPIWGLVILSAYFAQQGFYVDSWRFLAAIASLIGSAIPGHIIKYKARHEKPATP
jgi:hypothetical protein